MLGPRSRHTARVRIAVVEDDDGVAAAVVDVLRTHGHVAVRCGDLAAARAVVSGVDVVLLDLGLPDGDGLQLLRELRQRSDVPVLVMTARSEERDVVRALRLGADDHLVKPVRLRELLARIDLVVQRRPRRAAGAPADRVVVGDVELDLAAHRVVVGDRQVELTPKEFEVLAVLAHRPGQVVTRQQVLDEVWGSWDVRLSRSLDVHLAALRTKLDRPGLVTTVRGVGFRLDG